MDGVLGSLVWMPWVGMAIVAAIPGTQKDRIRQVGLLVSGLVFLQSLRVWLAFDNATAEFQMVEVYEGYTWGGGNLFIGVDGISLFFVILTTFLIPVCLLASWNAIQERVKEYTLCFLAMGSCTVAVFLVLDVLWFYVFFESVLIPMFLVIGLWGSRARKIRAGYQFFLYTFFGSVFMLLALLTMAWEAGTTDWQVLQEVQWSASQGRWLWLAFFLSFAIKIPMVPFHTWLPEAHVEAPTAGSVMLAGIMLKLGTYGMIRFLLPLFPEASAYFTPFVFTLSVIAIVYTSLTTLRQVDLKKIIAYSSVAHMGFVTLGLFTFNATGVEGSLLIMLSHGWVSSALFLCVGVLYDRYHTRLVKYYQGIGQGMPLFAVIFVFFSMANLGFPGTSSFVGEFLSLAGAFVANPTVAVLASLGTVLGAAYSVWLCNRVLFGTLEASPLGAIVDLNAREMMVFVPLIGLTLWMGVYPTAFMDPMHVSVANLLYVF
uniref:NADH-ubiquinone oxidoreductase chain 4 n=1 Tax=Hemiarma marina TaxID=1848298 RepID=A0A679ETL6_9CRYP|nr:NADH dehydrogenase subunit 4 [Hemiarma marina]